MAWAERRTFLSFIFLSAPQDVLDLYDSADIPLLASSLQ